MPSEEKRDAQNDRELLRLDDPGHSVRCEIKARLHVWCEIAHGWIARAEAAEKEGMALKIQLDKIKEERDRFDAAYHNAMEMFKNCESALCAANDGWRTLEEKHRAAEKRVAELEAEKEKQARTGFEPDVPVHVWETIKEALDARGLEFYAVVGWTSPDAISMFTMSLPTVALDAHDALSLSKATDLPASFFLNLQAAYYKDLARLQEREERGGEEGTDEK